MPQYFKCVYVGSLIITKVLIVDKAVCIGGQGIGEKFLYLLLNVAGNIKLL